MLPSLTEILLCVDVRRCLNHHHVSQGARQHVLIPNHLRSLLNNVCHNHLVHSKDVVLH